MIRPLNNTTPAVAQRLDVFDWSEAIDTDLYRDVNSYKNADGQEIRTSRIAVTTDAVLGGGSASIINLVDGTFTNCSSPWWLAGQSGRTITLQFAEPRNVEMARPDQRRRLGRSLDRLHARCGGGRCGRRQPCCQCDRLFFLPTHADRWLYERQSVSARDRIQD